MPAKGEFIRFEGKPVLFKEQAAAVLGIEPKRIDDCLAAHWPALRKAGYEVLRGERLRSFKRLLARFESDELDMGALDKAQMISIMELPAFVLVAGLLRERGRAMDWRSTPVLRAKPLPKLGDRSAAQAGSSREGEACAPAKPSDGVARAISIRQPYVEQILRGDKTEEYRSMKTNIRERVYLYASLRSSEYEEDSWREMGMEPGSLPTGLIVGTVEIFDCYWRTDMECFAYSLAKPDRLEIFLKPTNQPQPKFWIPQF
jgi:hypothetical protein